MPGYFDDSGLATSPLLDASSRLTPAVAVAVLGRRRRQR